MFYCVVEEIACCPPLINHNVMLNATAGFFKYVHTHFSAWEQSRGKTTVLSQLSELVGWKPVLRGSVNWFVAVVDRVVPLPGLPMLWYPQHIQSSHCYSRPLWVMQSPFVWSLPSFHHQFQWLLDLYVPQEVCLGVDSLIKIGFPSYSFLSSLQSQYKHSG